MKRKVVFPSVETSTEDGLVAIGGDLETDTLQEAYHNGIFPWPISLDFPLAWFSPDPRGLLFFDELHLSKSFEKFLKKCNFTVSFNQSFHEVILACARVRRKGQPSTWITPEIIKGYGKLFDQGLAYSVEVQNLEKKLIGGMYGVCMGTFFSGESMFMLEDNASKLALYRLIQRLQAAGIKWLDTQMVTPVVEQFGGKYVPRTHFIKMLDEVDWNIKRESILG